MSDLQYDGNTTDTNVYIKHDEQIVHGSLHRYAGFWMRFWAYLTDLIVIFSINGLLIGPIKYINEGKNIPIGFWTLYGLISIVVFYLYFLLMTKKFGQTLGKMIFGLIVIKRDGTELKWDDLLFREVVGRFIYKALGFLFLLYAVVGFTKEKQGLHDIFAQTRVIYKD